MLSRRAGLSATAGLSCPSSLAHRWSMYPAAQLPKIGVVAETFQRGRCRDGGLAGSIDTDRLFCAYDLLDIGKP